MNYLDAGYNQFLSRETQTPLPSEINPLQSAQLTDSISGEKIDSELDGQFVGNGIRANNISVGQMSFDRARGGTLLLGGQNNQNGVFSLHDDADNERIALNKDGMIINNGSLTIKDQDSNTVLDGDGLVSTETFNAGNVNGLLSSTTSGTYSDISGASLNFILKRKTRVMIFLSVYTYISNMLTDSTQGLYAVSVDGSILTSGIVLSYVDAKINATGESSATDSRYWTLSDQTIITLNAGAHNIKVQHKILRINSEILNLLDLSLTYLLLGS